MLQRELLPLDSAALSQWVDNSADSINLLSNCRPLDYFETPTFFWHTPHPVYADTAWAQRFTLNFPETLESIELLIYDEGNGTFGNDDLYVTLYEDNGFGLPGNELARVTVPAGTYPAYPAPTVVDFSSFGFVLYPEFHVAFSTSAIQGEDYENLISSDLNQGTFRSSGSGDPNSPGWYKMNDWWNVDINFCITVVTCGGEYPFPNCPLRHCLTGSIQNWPLPDGLGNRAHAQRFEIVSDTCALGDLFLSMIWPSDEPGLPLYTHNSEIQIFADSAGLPGELLGSRTIGPVEYTKAGLTKPGGPRTLRLNLIPLNIAVSDHYWIAVSSLAPDSMSGIRVMTDFGGGGCNFGLAQKNDNWELVSSSWSLPPDIAASIWIGECCTPPTLIEVPFDRTSIGLAIEASHDGDTILVHPGTYSENIVLINRNLKILSLFAFTGDSTYIDSTIIRGNSHESTVAIVGNQNDSTTIAGFTITHRGSFLGRGVFCDGSSPSISQNKIINNNESGILCSNGSNAKFTANLIKNNHDDRGGGIEITNSNPVFISNHFIGNSAQTGGVAYCFEGGFTMTDCVLQDNSALHGSIIYGSRSEINFVNCTFVQNVASQTGAFNFVDSQIEFDSSILAFNQAPLSIWYCEGPITNQSIHCSNLFGNSGGDWNFCGTVIDSTDNFSLNPLFCNPFSGDFQLNQHSPCAAANSLCGTLIGALDVGCDYLCGDATGDGALNLSDIVFLHQYYFECGALPAYFSAGDANCNGKIDIGDIVYLAAHLNSSGPPPCCP
ncbi:MAG TPA: right-handed parallel beta-helix repeat-containing protein [candidate division Zixibacteria bacterium]|nr:right-handed parallel beta-helix repeat-containing protein [candidate division Zixibacteria bacterium]